MKKGFLHTFVICAILTIYMVFNASPVIAQVYYNSNGTPSTSGTASQNKGIPNLGQGTQAPSTAGEKDGWFTNGMQSLVVAIMIYSSKFIAWIVSFAGTLFDKVIEYTTVFPGDLKLGITASWKIIRDFSNIILVFSLLYLGIKTILEGNGFADKKVLVGIIIAAIMINFSFFFVKDIAFNISNTVGLQVLEQAKLGGDKAKSFSEGLMSIVNPQQVLDNNQFPGTWGAYNIAEQDRTDWDLIFKMMGQMVMFTAVVICMAFVFLGASVILLYRFFIFIVLMIFAPIGLISTQIPWLQKIGKDWWEQLKKQTIFFPAFSLVLYIVLLIVSTLASLNNGKSITGTGMDTAFQFLFNFILIMGFMFALLVLPGKLGAAGSGFMTNAGGYLKNKAKNLPRSSVQFGGRMAASGVARTGRLVGGKLIGDKLIGGKYGDRLKSLAQDPGSGWRGRAARATLETGDGLKNSSFDVRNTKSGAKLGFGKGIEGYSAAVESKKKSLKEREAKEKKLFGFDKPKQTDDQKHEAKIALIQAETNRDASGDLVKNKREELKVAKARKASAADMAKISEEIVKAEADLEKDEMEVGKLMDVGNASYQKLMEQRQERIFGLKRYSITEAAALEKYKKEIDKEWKEKGKYKSESNKNNTPKVSTPPPQSSRATNYITLPPNLPPPTGL